MYVTDANGAPASNRDVTLSIDPLTYGKGRLVWPVSGTLSWRYSSDAILPSSVAACLNEDINRNGIFDVVDKDLNVDGILQPGLPVVITATVRTDASGFAPFTLSYGKNYALWVSTQITARSLVGGTESKQTQTYDLEMLIDDALAEGNPANVVSPFGTTVVNIPVLPSTDTSGCANPN